MYITKQQTSHLKGIAIILMLFHHLYAFPYRITSSSDLIYSIPNVPLEKYFGLMSKICVPLFLFVSGYGFFVIGVRRYKYYLHKIIEFYRNFWIIFFIFVPIGLLYFSDNENYIFDRTNFLLNLAGLSFNYNKEWWFIEPYLYLVALTPVINTLRNCPKTLTIISAALMLTGFYAPLPTTIWSEHIEVLLMWQTPFILGYVIASCHARGLLTIEQFSTVKNKPFISTVFLILFTIIFYTLNNVGLIILTTPLVYFLLLLSQKLPLYYDKALVFLGNRSMNIWLTHTFLCYYYFQDFILAPRYSPLVYLNLLLSSLAISIIISKVQVLFALPFSRTKAI